MTSVHSPYTPAAPHLPRLPQELTDIVIDYLHADRRALASCSFVCKAWLLSSSLHLFEQLHWPPLPSVREDDNAPDPPSRGSRVGGVEGPTTPDLFPTLAASWRLQQSVRELTISSMRYTLRRGRSRIFVPSPDNARISFMTLLDILELLPRLVTLTLIGSITFSAPSPLVETRRASVENVVIKSHGAERLDDVAFLQCFERIGVLSVFWQPYTGFESRGPVAPEDRVRLHSLRLFPGLAAEKSASSLYDVLSSILDLESLRHITLCHPTDCLAAFVSKLPNLETAQFTILDWDGGPPLPLLPPCSTLQTLVIRTSFDSWMHAARQIEHSATSVLGCLEISLAVDALCRTPVQYHAIETQLRLLEWSSVRGALERCGSLRTFRFTALLSPSYPLPDAERLKVVSLLTKVVDESLGNPRAFVVEAACTL